MLYQKSYISKIQAEILALFVSKLKSRFTINEVSKELKKPYPLIHKNAKMLIKKGFISKDEHNLLFLSNRAEPSKLAYVESLRADRFLESNKGVKVIINDLLSGIKQAYFTLLVFGSYASGKVSRNSDLDILVIVEKEAGEVERDIKRITSRFPIKIHAIVLGKESVYEMLQKRKEGNVITETLDSHIIFFGAENYHKMVQNAG